MKDFVVYEHIFPNGKMYIGITCQKPEQRWKNGKGYFKNTYMLRAINKYGWDNIEHNILANGISKEEAEKMEIELIAKHKSNELAHGYNICSGGCVNVPTKEGRKRISEAQKGNKTWLGKKHSKESKRKIALAMQHITDETRTKMSEARKRRITKDETREKMSISHKGKPKTIEHRRAIALSNQTSHIKEQKTVIQIAETFTVTYDGIKKASRITGIASASIIRCCKGKQKTAGGYTWRYKEEIV